MKAKVFEYIMAFIWVLIVFCWAIYTNIPKGTLEYVVKTLPLILLGVWIIECLLRKYKRKT